MYCKLFCGVARRAHLTAASVRSTFTPYRQTGNTASIMQESYPVIAKVPTHILTWGKWIEESLGDQKEIVLCITGNPGLPGFYTKFLSTVYECLNKELPVWVIGEYNVNLYLFAVLNIIYCCYAAFLQVRRATMKQMKAHTRNRCPH